MTVAESDQRLAELKQGTCICEELDDAPCDTYKHPMSRLHHEQLLRQRPRTAKLTEVSDAPHMSREPVVEEERFAKKSRQYAYE
eukprot:CAMPEP_0195125258 /NCGR_PEP_ID=MMETSP0448-20130528/132671_1 /TAXON_ID=66468 /ORGANISM="Heterocapsa triquestra, Strain CCMP 448" /LENGTH=83 /DNA_ID=CAMNT_0040162887 /DNA_START=10 /DNA_END=258 /DNA_ORIENTATION=-